jgi:hypothetical protein
VLFPKELARESDDLTVGRVIQRFDTLNLGFEAWSVFGDMLHEHGFFAGRSGDENSSSVRQRIGDILKVGLVFCSVAAADRIRLVVNVAHRVFWAYDSCIPIRSVEMEDAGLVMVDPYDSVKMIRHDLSRSARLLIEVCGNDRLTEDAAICALSKL